MSSAVTILHISDIQFGRNHRFGSLGVGSADATFDNIFDRLRFDLAALSKDSITPNIIVMSGDLAEMGKKEELSDGIAFLDRLGQHLSIPRRNIIIVPGNHDINRKLCEGYFATCEGEGVKPTPPYSPKWKHFISSFNSFYGGENGIQFTDEQPWSLYELPELKVVVAGLNSTMVETHEEGTHYGWTGEVQLHWFAEKLKFYAEKGWLRVAVVHHNLDRGAVLDDEHLRDRDDFVRIVGPYVNAVMHGHTHEGRLGWISPITPILSTGSAALKAAQRPEEIANQYQVVRFSSKRLERWIRKYDPMSKRWIGDTRNSIDGDAWYIPQSIPFSNVDCTFPAPPAECTLPEERPEQRIVSLDKSLTAAEAEQKLQSLPRFGIKPDNQHRAVRRDAQDKVLTAIKRSRLLWLVADWNLGKDGFLAAALERAGGPQALETLFRLQCGHATSCEDLLALAETQLGLSFQEFSAAIAATPSGYLVFDDLPNCFVEGAERERFAQKITPLFDFCPNLTLILVTRKEPPSVPDGDVVKLHPLDAAEVRQYLQCHNRSSHRFDEWSEIERIHAWSEGLPIHLDRLVDRLPYLQLSEILADETHDAMDGSGESVPVSLAASIAELEKSDHPRSRKSLKLLKVLTILRDGETFQSIKRFYREPFYQNNIDELVTHRLLESVPISQTAPDLGVGYRARVLTEPPKLLRVPRQVRDYVNSLMSDAERDDIIQTSMELLFGQKWWRGKIRLRTTISNAYGESAILGPGNEHLVGRFVLSKALEKGNKTNIIRYAQVCLNYCTKLLESDRFRDALIASEALMELLRNSEFKKQFIEVCVIYGRSLRMMHRLNDAVDALETALGAGVDIIDDFKSDIKLSLALAYKSLERTSDSLSAAQEVIDLSHAESSNAFQAKAVIAELTLAGSALRTRLLELEQEARNKGHKGAANNIALGLARETADPNEALEWLNKVIYSSKDSYNRARAVIEKATILAQNHGLSGIKPEDYRLLGAAYSYSYAQRMGTLVDRCHGVLWGICRQQRLLPTLLRLFRFSSFIWRLRGNESTEGKYLIELRAEDISRLSSRDRQDLHNEILYLERRLASQSAA